MDITKAATLMRKKSRILKIKDVNPLTTEPVLKKSRIRGFIELVSWIIGIFCGVLLIQQAFFPRLLDKKKLANLNFSSQVSHTDSLNVSDSIKKSGAFLAPIRKKEKTKKHDTVSAEYWLVNEPMRRQASEEDIAYILDQVPHKYFIAINYQNGFESRQYAYSLSEKIMSLGYRSMGYIVDSVPVNNISKRFVIIKHDDTAIINIKRISY